MIFIKLVLGTVALMAATTWLQVALDFQIDEVGLAALWTVMVWAILRRGQ